MRAKIGALLCALATLTACGSDKPQHPLADAGVVIATPVEPEPDTVGTEDIGSFYALLDLIAQRLTASAGIVRPVGGKCDSTTVKPQFHCTATFLGETITYTVITSVAHRDTNSVDYTYDMKPDHLVATRAGIEAALWYQKARISSRLACDEGLPEQALVTPGGALPHQCYVTPLPLYGDEPYAVRITINDGEIVFEPVLSEA